MDRKQRMSSFIATLLVFATLSILPIDVQAVCPWCDKSMQPRLLDCVYTGMISSPELMMIPLRDIEDVKWQVASYSDSKTYMPYEAKKVDVDEKFCSVIADVVRKNNYQNNYLIINVISKLAGNCYSSVTGYDPDIVTEDVKARVKENIRKSESAPEVNPNPEPNSRMPYSANQNQQNNFQSPWSPIQPPLNAPFNPPGSPPINSLSNPPSGNNRPFNSPGSSSVNSFDKPTSVNNRPFDSAGSPPVNSFGNSPSGRNTPFNHPGSALLNSFNNPSSGNNAPVNPPGPTPGKSLENPSFGRDDSSNPPLSPPMNPYNNSSFGNNTAGPSENWALNDNGQGRATSEFSQNQAPSDSSSGSSLQNDKKSQDYNNSPDNPAPDSTVSPKISSSSQDSKLTNSFSSENSNWTTLSPNTDAPLEKTAGNEKAEEEQPCDEKFKTALYEELINDDRFCKFFTKLPISSTKPEVPKIINHAFKKYGIDEHYTEFTTFWRFESKTLNKESTAKDWDEVISKILKIICSRNDLLKGDCKEEGKKMAGYILDTFPGETAVSSTENTNKKDGDDETSTESNSNSSDQKAHAASNSPESTSTENNSNSEKATDSGSLSFPELHSKLSSMLKNNGSTEQKDVPFSELLTKIEMQDVLGKLHRAALDCTSPSGFDFDKFFQTMTNVADSIQKNHPDWSKDKCHKETYSATIAVLTEQLQQTLKASNNNAKGQSSSTQPSSAVDTSDSQSSNSGAQPQVPNDYNLSSDDSTYQRPGADFASGSSPQQKQDFTNYGGYADGTGPENISSPQNQHGPDDRNTGFPQPSAQNYPAGPPTNMNTRPFSGQQPSPNAGFQQTPNFAPDYGVMNPPNKNFGNSQLPADYPSHNYGFDAGAPVAAPNGNSQNLPPFNRDYDYSAPIAGPNYNTQPQLNSNYNSGAPPVEPNYNTQPQFKPNYNSGAPPVEPNYNTQPQFKPNYNSGAPPVEPNYNMQPQSNYNSRVPANGPPMPQW